MELSAEFWILYVFLKERVRTSLGFKTTGTADLERGFPNLQLELENFQERRESILKNAESINKQPILNSCNVTLEDVNYELQRRFVLPFKNLLKEISNRISVGSQNSSACRMYEERNKIE